MAESESTSRSGFSIPGPWFIGMIMGLGALLGFAVSGLGDFTAWFMALVAVLSFAYPFLVGR